MSPIQDGARYVIVNVVSGTVMDLSGEDNRSIIGYPSHGGKNQQWEAKSHDGGWALKNVDKGTYLAPENHGFRDDLRLIAQDHKYTWHIWEDAENKSALRICVPNTVFNADLTDNGNAAPGTPIALWGRWNGKNQTWFFEKVDD